MENASKELTDLIDLDERSDFQMVAASVSAAEGALILPRQTAAVSRHAVAAPGQNWSLERAVDVVMALGLIVMLAPVMLVVFCAVKLTSSGPAVFAHPRLGLNGEKFRCLKFRSMYDGAEAILTRLLREDPAMALEWQTLQKLENDPRVTPLGRFLRSTSLDELPQLFNVLKGEMSLVGPRPIVEAELERYGRYQASYLGVKPGLTGLWQVTGRSGTTYQRRVATDHLYCKRKCLAFDLRIIFATVPAVLFQRGAC